MELNLSISDMDLALHSTENTNNTDMNENDNFHHTLLNKIDEIKNKITDKEYKDLLDILHRNKIDSEKDENSKVVIELELMYPVNRFCYFDEGAAHIDTSMEKKNIQETVTVKKYKELLARGYIMWSYTNSCGYENGFNLDYLDNCVEHFNTVYDYKEYDKLEKHTKVWMSWAEVNILSCKIVDVV
jgi:hypothetical protein